MVEVPTAPSSDSLHIIEQQVENHEEMPSNLPNVSGSSVDQDLAGIQYDDENEIGGASYPSSTNQEPLFNSSMNYDLDEDYDELFELENLNSDEDDELIDEEEALTLYEAELSSSPSISEEIIDINFVYAIRRFEATVEGQVTAEKGDMMMLLDDSNSYWWLVKICRNSDIGYLPAEYIETPSERLARQNKYKNSDTSSSGNALPAPSLASSTSKSDDVARVRVKRVAFNCPIKPTTDPDMDDISSENDYEAMVNRAMAENGLEIEFSTSNDTSSDDESINGGDAIDDDDENNTALTEVQQTSTHSSLPPTDVVNSDSERDFQDAVSSDYKEHDNNDGSETEDQEDDEQLFHNHGMIAPTPKFPDKASSPLKRALSTGALKIISPVSLDPDSDRPLSCPAPTLSEESHSLQREMIDLQDHLSKSPNSSASSGSKLADRKSQPNSNKNHSDEKRIPSSLISHNDQFIPQAIRHSVSLELATKKEGEVQPLYSSSAPASPTIQDANDDSNLIQKSIFNDQNQLLFSKFSSLPPISVNDSSIEESSETITSPFRIKRKALPEESFGQIIINNEDDDHDESKENNASGEDSMFSLYQSSLVSESEKNDENFTPDLISGSGEPSTPGSHDFDTYQDKSFNVASSDSPSTYVSPPTSFSEDIFPKQESFPSKVPDAAQRSFSQRHKDLNRRLKSFIADPDSVSDLYWTVKSAGVRASPRSSYPFNEDTARLQLEETYANVLRSLSDELASAMKPSS
ncbi:tip elongation aberrant protein Tea4 [Schizosaccharomyces cryophilus OY26]|uniref:Tip elongation aberrant protein Tea4 n=1 Tax=Schizosaccharomyces cryophilus (strain OY26 / ATCC MYA-4695 / CBS 11777 / NBRC 106824 / NRRL Y48691) TaxID=653667 RepID=S9X9V6_SCHCR|nr:tip elongation aberrant protein Tea4 [Schizosaccharomyces cryophilus OY26]EPY50546.1 tip elongation aberrant protein Tea4 [Schizosaccharomyces cryophilus OY26]